MSLYPRVLDKLLSFPVWVMIMIAMKTLICLLVFVYFDKGSCTEIR